MVLLARFSMPPHPDISDVSLAMNPPRSAPIGATTAGSPAVHFRGFVIPALFRAIFGFGFSK